MKRRQTHRLALLASGAVLVRRDGLMQRRRRGKMGVSPDPRASGGQL